MVFIYGYRICCNNPAFILAGIRYFKTGHEFSVKKQPAVPEGKYHAACGNVYVYGDKLSRTTIRCVQKQRRSQMKQISKQPERKETVSIKYFDFKKVSVAGFCNFCRNNIPLVIAVTFTLFFS